MVKGVRARFVVGALLAGVLAACGGSSPSNSTPQPTPTPVPAVTITAIGEGVLTVHPSSDSRFGAALETPIRVTETTGGTASWNFARISFFLSGREIERNELGANDIATAGYSRISARSNTLYRVIFRTNSGDFDRVDITLGFSDLMDGRQFTVAVPFSSFSDVNVSFTPMSVPGAGTVKVGPPQ
jgi:hypothetical protein